MSLLAGAVHVKLDAESMGLSKGVQKAGNDISGLEKSSGQAERGFLSMGRIADYAIGNILSNALTTATSKFMEFLGTQKDSASEFEATRMAFDGLLGSAEIAGSVMNDIVKEAQSTPFEIPELAESGKMLAAFGVEADKIVPSIRMVGDVAAGLNVPIKDMAYLVGTIKTQGKAMTADLNQFANRGVPIWKELGKITGLSGEALRKYAEEGNVSFEIIEKAFSNMTKEGGQFYGMMARQSKTLNGLTSTLGDAMSALGRKILGVTDTGEVIEGQLFDKIRQGTAGMIEFMNSPFVSNFASGIGKGIGWVMDKFDQFKGRVIDVGKNLIEIGKLIVSGDFTKPIFGQQEDSAFINYLLTVREFYSSIWNIGKLLATGDFSGGIFGLAEDHPFIGFLFQVREGFIWLSQNVLPLLVQKLNEFSNWWTTTALPAISNFYFNVYVPFILNAFNWFVTNVVPGVLWAGQMLVDMWTKFIAPAVMNAWTNFLQPALVALWDAIKAIWPVLVDLWNIIAPVIIPVLAVLGAIIIGVVVAAFWILSAVIRVVAEVVKWVAQGIAGAWNWIKDTVTGTINNIQNAINTGINIFNAFKNKAEEIKNAIVGAFNGIQNGIGNALKGVVNGLIDNLNRAVGGVNNIIRNLPDIPGVGKVPTIPTIPKFKRGVTNFEGGLAEVHKNELLVNMPEGTDVMTASETRRVKDQGDEESEPEDDKPNPQYHFHFDDVVFADDKNIRDLARRVKRVFAEEGI